MLRFRRGDLRGILGDLSHCCHIHFSYPVRVKRVGYSNGLILFSSVSRILRALRQALSVSFDRQSRMVGVRCIRGWWGTCRGACGIGFG